MTIRLLAIALAVLAAAPIRAMPPTMADDALEAAGARALAAGDYAAAVERVLPRAQAGDPEFQFSLGYLAYLWQEAPTPMQPPRYTLEEPVGWMRRAAHQGLPQAAEVLGEGYERRRFGLPRQPVLAACWREVARARQQAAACEALASTATPD